MGESKRRRKSTLAGFEEGGEQPQVVDTLGGRMRVRWDPGGGKTAGSVGLLCRVFCRTPGGVPDLLVNAFGSGAAQSKNQNHAAASAHGCSWLLKGRSAWLVALKDSPQNCPPTLPYLSRAGA